MEQGAFEFPERRARDLPDTVWCVMGWKNLGDGDWKIEAHWPIFNQTTWFRNWREALDAVLHELNTNVRVKVRCLPTTPTRRKR